MYWLLYDITKTKIRNRVIKECLNYGMKRMQKSCFFGDMDRKSFIELGNKIEGFIDKTDSVLLIPITKGSMDDMTVLGKQLRNKVVDEEVVWFI